MNNDRRLPMNFVDKVVELHAHLADARIPHAFGGALALAYHARPRGTTDIDVDLFLPPKRADEVFAALAPVGVSAPDEGEQAPPAAGRRGWWDGTAVDVFFAYDEEYFGAVARRAEHHLFLGTGGGEHHLPFPSAEDLAVFKVTFDRPRDWVDIEEMLRFAPLDLAYVEWWLLHLGGERMWPRLRRFTELAARTELGQPRRDEPNLPFSR